MGAMYMGKPRTASTLDEVRRVAKEVTYPIELTGNVAGKDLTFAVYHGERPMVEDLISAGFRNSIDSVELRPHIRAR